jgi:molybdopterin-guanine dinucleotide biosynthesis protein A
MAEGVTGIILAGGESRRMGRDKAFLPWGDTTLIEHLLERLRPVTDEVIVAVNPALSRKGGVKDARAFRHLKARVVEDCVPDAHALGGLYTGLRAASHEVCFVCACDVPFLHPALIRFLIKQAEGYDAVIPRTPTGIQPLSAVYRKSALLAIKDQLHQQQFTLARLAERLRVHIVKAETLHRFDATGLSFLNVNTPEEYIAACNIRTHQQEQ